MLNLDLFPLETPFWASGGHAQTIIGHLLPSRGLARRGMRTEIPLPDGDQLIAEFLPGLSDAVVYIFHGLGGDTVTDYMKRTARLALDLGHSVYLTNHRGCGEGTGLAKKPYHSGRGEDISRVIEFGRKAHPSKKHLAIGFSLSGNALLTLLTGLRGEVLPDAAIAVNAPIDLTACVKAIHHGLNRIYERRFVGLLRDHLKRNHSLQAPSVSVPRRATLWDFDSLYTAPAGGFRDAQDYYDQCSTQPHLSRIEVPTVLLTAQDDPFVPFESYRRAYLSETTVLHAERSGGHMGYISREKTPLGTHRWLDYALTRAIPALLAKT